MTTRDWLEGIGFGAVALLCSLALAAIGVVQVLRWGLALILLGSWLLGAP